MNLRFCVGLFTLLCVRLGGVSQNSVAITSRYSGVTSAVEQMIETEMKNQSLPAVSIALVDDQQVVWAHGMGLADSARKVAATAATVYRVGSVSKLFTDMAIMQLMEKGEIDLDAPITRYLPDFHPKNPFPGQITLRELMSHRSGLVREPPLGHYFDATDPTLKATVRSLNATTLVYPPGKHTKYSNAAIAVVGYLLQEHYGQPFPGYVRDAVLRPLGMTNSSFVPTSQVSEALARASIRTYDGRVLDAPTFQLGMMPAGCMYSSVLDLAEFLKMMFADGAGKKGRVLKPETLLEMWRPQFPEATSGDNFGIGFRLSEINGHQLVGHGGAIYGFATELEALPQDKLGVVVVTTSDSANASTTKLAHEALRLMMAAKDGTSLPVVKPTTPVPLTLARIAAARYGSGKGALDLLEENGTLSMLSTSGGNQVGLRQLGDELITDDRLAYGKKIQLFNQAIKVDSRILSLIPDKKPLPPPKTWDGLIGEFGWDYDTL